MALSTNTMEPFSGEIIEEPTRSSISTIAASDACLYARSSEGRGPWSQNSTFMIDYLDKKAYIRSPPLGS